METAASLVITQLSDYLRGLAQRLDPGAGWYGEFLRRDPEGMRACLDGAAMPPWDVVESLLGDLAEARGPEFAAREAQYAARLRAEAAAAWDRLPGGAEELQTLIVAAAEQRDASEAAARSLTTRLTTTADRAEADAVAGELAWLRDDAARAASRHADLTARLTALTTPTPALLPAVPRQRPEPPAAAASPPGGATGHPGTPPAPAPPPASAPAADPQAGHPDRDPHEGPYEGPGGAPGAGSGGAAPGRAGRVEGRWPRGRTRRAGGARYAGSAAPEPTPFSPPPGHPAGPGTGSALPRGARFGHLEPHVPELPEQPERPERSAPREQSAQPQGRGPAVGPPRGARFGRPQPQPQPEPQPEPVAVVVEPQGAGSADGWPGAGSAPQGGGAEAVRGRGVRGTVTELITLRAQGRSGEAHALLCEAAAWSPGLLPELAAELVRAGLAADWATLLWEAASLPPERLAAVAAALGAAGRHADCEALLRQGVSRPAAELAEAALALVEAGRPGEADALLGAFVRARTAEESARLARRDPQWFVPRLLRAAEAVSAGHHRDLVHALRVGKFFAS
ncbi:hypothetical protein ACSHWO_07280 [Streptomyces sp. HUAS TT3]|uniref:hypothetical protein n=1 Tax=Streptomyces sp. HUAS TT3 TaxID=3447510 RepID=UPI003F654D2F